MTISLTILTWLIYGSMALVVLAPLLLLFLWIRDWQRSALW